LVEVFLAFEPFLGVEPCGGLVEPDVEGFGEGFAVDGGVCVGEGELGAHFFLVDGDAVEGVGFLP
jgi:hypothetical protein